MNAGHGAFRRIANTGQADLFSRKLTGMKKPAWFLAVLTVVCFGSWGVIRAKHAGAFEPKPPSKMELLDAAQLDAHIAHLRRIQTAAQIESAPHVAKAQEIAGKYKFDLAALGQSVQVDFATGEIKRAEAAPPK